MEGISYAQALDAIQARLGEAAVAHCVRVSATAEELALAYGVDAGRAKLAGLLHDWDREQSPSALVLLARQAGLVTTPADEAVPYLLHARTAAVSLKHAMPVLPPEILTAVARHTLGAADMSELDMIIYLADMLEPARTYPGVQALRDAVGKLELHELFVLGYQHSLSHIVSSRRPIHPETVTVWNALVAERER